MKGYFYTGINLKYMDSNYSYFEASIKVPGCVKNVTKVRIIMCDVQYALEGNYTYVSPLYFPIPSKVCFVPKPNLKQT